MVDDAELRRRLALLKQRLSDGKMVVSEHLRDGFEESFGAVRYGPDGEIDLSTVDGRVRSMALMVAVMDDREQVKNAASLVDVQRVYFRTIEANFGDLYERMITDGASPHQISSALARHPENVEHFYPVISEFMTWLTEFWESVGDVVSYHLQDMNVTKGVFGGDLFPTDNIASTCGLYVDTIVLTDPFMNCRSLFPRWSKEEAVRYLLKNAMNVLSYKELALADLPTPIVVILPFESSFKQDQFDTIAEWAKDGALIHAGKIFGRRHRRGEE